MLICSSPLSYTLLSFLHLYRTPFLFLIFHPVSSGPLETERYFAAPNSQSQT